MYMNFFDWELWFNSKFWTGVVVWLKKTALPRSASYHAYVVNPIIIWSRHVWMVPKVSCRIISRCRARVQLRKYCHDHEPRFELRYTAGQSGSTLNPVTACGVVPSIVKFIFITTIWKKQESTISKDWKYPPKVEDCRKWIKKKLHLTSTWRLRRGNTLNPKPN